MAAGEGVEPSSSDSKSDVFPITPSRNLWSMVAAEGIEPSSPDYRSGATAVELQRESFEFRLPSFELKQRARLPSRES